MSGPRRPRVVVTGGGTAGHVEPALAVARALGPLGIDPAAIVFVGARRGMEATLVPAAGFEVVLLPGRGLRRGAPVANAAALAGLFVALARAVVLVARWRPDVVVMVGGYAGVAASLAARVRSIPVVVVNVDAEIGRANRVVSRFAARIYLAVAGSAPAGPGARSPGVVEVTGPPVRSEVLAVDRSEEGRRAARQAIGVAEDRLLLAVVGGSLGAASLNRLALGLRERFWTRSDLTLYHVAGARNLAETAASLPADASEPGGLDYRLVGFEAALPSLFCAADLVIARAGAMTVAELAVIGVPSILVPLPGAPGDHQRVNAALLETVGAAFVLDDADAVAATVGPVVEELLGDPDRLSAMGRAARTVARPEAAKRIAEGVAEVAGAVPHRSRRERQARSPKKRRGTRR